MTTTNNKHPKKGEGTTVTDDLKAMAAELFSTEKQAKFFDDVKASADKLVEKRTKGITDKIQLEKIRDACLIEAMTSAISPYTSKLAEQPIFTLNSIGHKIVQGVVTVGVATVGVGIAAYVTGGRRSETAPPSAVTQSKDNPFDTDFQATTRPKKTA